MAFVAAASQDASFNNAGDAVTFAFDAGATSDRAMLISITWHNSGGHTLGDTAVTYGGVELAPFGATASGGATSKRLYGVKAPASGSNTVSVDPSAGVSTNNATIDVIVYDTIDQTTPFDGYATPTTGTDTTAEITVVSEDGDTPVYFMGARCLTPTGVAATNYTERADNVNSNIISTCGEGTGAASVDFTGTISATGINNWVAMAVNLNAGGSVASAALTGTVTQSIVEADVVAGGKTIILTLTNDTWVASGATFDGQRQNIIDGLDAAQSEATGWNAEVRDNEVVTAVARTSDTVVTITLSAAAAYAITDNETVTATIPATALTGAQALVASPTFSITNQTAGTAAESAFRRLVVRPVRVR